MTSLHEVKHLPCDKAAEVIICEWFYKFLCFFLIPTKKVLCFLMSVMRIVWDLPQHLSLVAHYCSSSIKLWLFHDFFLALRLERCAVFTCYFSIYDWHLYFGLFVFLSCGCYVYSRTSYSNQATVKLSRKCTRMYRRLLEHVSESQSSDTICRQNTITCDGSLLLGPLLPLVREW